MLSFLIKKISQQSSRDQQRTKLGLLAGILGFVSNLVLFLAKLSIGYLSGSVSIMADAINNLSDTASSILTLVGFKIAGKPADKEHPYGHERFEYISGFLISILIVYVGLQFLQTSINKILHPENLVLSPIIFIVLILSILIKVWQAASYKKIAAQIQSNTLMATAQDSLNDVITTITVLVSAGIEALTGWRIDGAIGLLIALYILFSGVKMIKEFVDELMGSRPSDDAIEQMKQHLAEYPTILGYHDLLVHNYGPTNVFASVHIEVDETWSLTHAHHIIDEIEQDFRSSLDVELVCHLDPVAVHNQTYNRISLLLTEIIRTINPDLKLHDLRIDDTDPQLLHFDLAVPSHITNSDSELTDCLQQEVFRIIGDYRLNITFDHNYLL